MSASLAAGIAIDDLEIVISHYLCLHLLVQRLKITPIFIIIIMNLSRLLF